MADAPQFVLWDQSRTQWSLADHIDASVLIIFYRGDW